MGGISTSNFTPCSRSCWENAGSKASDQAENALAGRPEGRWPGEAQQVADAAVEAVHFLDDGVQVLTRRWRLRVEPDDLGRRAEAGQRVPQSVSDRGRHLADRGQLLGLDQLRLGAFQLGDLGLQLVVEPDHVGSGLPEVVGHAGEGSCQLADLVPGVGGNRVIEITGPDHRHRSGELADRPGQAAGYEPGTQQPGGQGEDHDHDEHPLLRGKNFLQAGIGPTNAGLARPAVDVPVELGEGRMQPALELLLGHGERRLAPARVVELEDGRGGGLDLLLDVPNPFGQPHLLRPQLGRPALLPVVHHLPRQRNSFLAVGSIPLR